MLPPSSWASCVSSSCMRSKTSMNALKRNCPYQFLAKWSSSSCRLESPTGCLYRVIITWMLLGRFQLGSAATNVPPYFFPSLYCFLDSFLMYCQASPSHNPRVLPDTSFARRLLRCSDCGILDRHLSFKDLRLEAWLQCGRQPGQ